METKKCNKCGEIKPIKEFRKAKTCKGNMSTYCRKCLSLCTAKTPSHQPEARRIYERERQKRPGHKEKALKLTLSWRKRNPEAVACWTIFKKAIKEKRIIRVKKCVECGSDIQVEAHHEDYSKPLEVLWLCRKCHYHKHKFPFFNYAGGTNEKNMSQMRKQSTKAIIY